MLIILTITVTQVTSILSLEYTVMVHYILCYTVMRAEYGRMN